MTKQHFKHVTLSFILIYIWILYNFFAYYNGSMSSLTLFFNFLAFVALATGVGILLLLLRITFFRKSKQFQLKNNFFYTFVGLFNLNLSIIWIISITMKMINLDFEGLSYVLGNVIIAIFILVDLYYFKEKPEIEIIKI
ncbi:hypothetical protein [Flavobacterium pectinovorum]|uniref:Uncharacterized protein n=1 Tax=Flavobacterium pectinovorum TaxID=29533 RepID=A0A502EIL8_9FLAO|nr:hypothetical protein [Flavobacterium pectinovorum]TPG36340.1 hypothetical protein EAH81_19910 [Flavobacterium pectinovorum]